MALTPEQIEARRLLGLPLDEGPPPVPMAPAVPFSNAHTPPAAANLLAGMGSVDASWVGGPAGQQVALPAPPPPPPSPPPLPANPTMEQVIQAGNARPQGGPLPPPKAPPPPPDIKRDQPGAAGAAPAPAGMHPMIPMGGGGRTVAAHSVPLVDPAVQARIHEAYADKGAAIDAEKDAAKARGEAEEAGHLAQAGQHLLIAERRRSEDARIREQADRDMAALKEEQEKLDKFSQELAATKFDPKRNFSTWDNIRFGIAAMLAGALQGWGKARSNFAIDQLNHLMDQELNRQYAEFNAKKGRMGDLENLYSKAYAATKDREQAYRLASQWSLQAMQDEADALASSSNAAVSRAAADQVRALLEERKAENALTEWTHDSKMNKWVPKQTSGGIDWAAIRKRAIAISDKAAEHGIAMDPGEAQRRAFMEYTGKDPYARPDVPLKGYEKDQAKPLPAGATSDAQVLAAIDRLIPKEMQKDALKEFQTYKRAQRAIAYINNVFSGEPGQGPWDRRRDVDENTLALEMKGILGPGFASDKDFDTLKTWSPRPTDSAETRAYKRQQVQAFIQRNAGTPILDSYGIGPKATPTDAQTGAKDR